MESENHIKQIGKYSLSKQENIGILVEVHIVCVCTAEREEGRLKDEMRRFHLEREDLKEKMNIYEVQ